MASIIITDNNNNFFEGAEKLLEIWFSRTDCELKNCDLRNIPRQALDDLLKMVKCEVISFNQNDYIDAYVLSESSMFISQRRFILKTCGNTMLLSCVKPLLYLVQQYTSFNEIEDMYYSRKNFMHPELQPHPHHSFSEESSMLDKMFRDGASYCMGRMNQDCWYLYTKNPLNARVQRDHVEADQTFEMLMTELDPEVMKIFTKDECPTGPEATKKSGIDKIIPHMKIDDFIFTPCGYSMNGIRDDGCYMTIHITPEPDCSYVSFETNVPQSSYVTLIRRVLNTFRPGRFIVTVFANESSPSIGTQKDLQDITDFGQYRILDLQQNKLKNYDLTYALYAKFPS